MYVSDGKRRAYKREIKKRRRMSTFSNLRIFLTLKTLTSVILLAC